MLAHERQQQIMKLLEENGSIRINEIVQRFAVSNETARRDLDYLQKRGYARRVHGGANAIDTTTNNLSELTDDDDSSLSVVELLAKAAAEQVAENDVIFIGQGTTMYHLARAIKSRKNLTVLTNSLRVISELVDSTITLYSLGGLVDRDEQNMNGSIPISVIQKFYANKAFISCGGISDDGNISDYNNDGTLNNLMLQLSDRHFLVADSSKFDRHAFCHVCKISDFDMIISDKNLPEKYRQMLEQYGATLCIADN